MAARPSLWIYLMDLTLTEILHGMRFSVTSVDAKKAHLVPIARTDSEGVPWYERVSAGEKFEISGRWFAITRVDIKNDGLVILEPTHAPQPSLFDFDFAEEIN